jgi:L-ribulose-5-phosphate 3-epimerase
VPDHPPILGVCSWSLRPTSAADLVEKVRSSGLQHVQLHLDPIRRNEWPLQDTLSRLKAAGITIASGMMSMKNEDYSTLDTIRQTGGIAPDETWPENLAAARANASTAREFGIPLVTFHAGFLPHARGDSKRKAILARLAELSQVFNKEGVRIPLETGQEDAPTLQGVLTELNALLPPAAHVGVNFDPANIILYGMGDPASAATKLAPHIMQVHVKDAVPSKTPGTWGNETPTGQGSVGWPNFLTVLERAGVHCPLMIEREAGETRVEDVTAAARLIQQALQPGATR